MERLQIQGKCRVYRQEFAVDEKQKDNPTLLLEWPG